MVSRRTDRSRSVCLCKRHEEIAGPRRQANAEDGRRSKSWSLCNRQLVSTSENEITGSARLLKKEVWPTLILTHLFCDCSGFVIDCPFPASLMKDPSALSAQIKLMTGVVEVGLFCNVAKAAYFGNQDGTITAKAVGGKVSEGIQFDVSKNPFVQV